MRAAIVKRVRRWAGDPLPNQAPSHAERVARIRRLTDELAGIDEDELRARAARLEGRADDGEALDSLAEELFALAGEASRRRLGMRPFDVQIRAGLALLARGEGRGTVIEMQTGEGKTLTAVAPVALHALTHRGVHVLTVNDYLARRDAEWMGPVYELLGLTVGCVQEGMSVTERHAAYRCDVTYLTAREAGFDLLRDALCLDPGDQVHRPFHLALVDEADSILIDEARIPLVIAGDVGDEPPGLSHLAQLASRLQPGVHFATDEHDRNIYLTDEGTLRVERELGCGNLAEPRNAPLHAAMRNALHAEAFLRRDVDYLVRDGAIELVDELTGRVAENRRWPDGLQPAVEAKEGLRLRKEGTILGSITLQHLLALYPRLCGMTGTAQPAARELRELYGLEVTVVPTHRPCIRDDRPDRLFAIRAAKHRAVLDTVARLHADGQPVLVGTVSVEESERLAERIRAAGIACRVLNAKHHAEEAAIVAEAGGRGAVTISTNMAGRGTDIRLGGAGGEEHGVVAALGGLHVIGTNRHESRRIDDQLRGRAGRQGDSGSSRFYLSLEDDLLVRYRIRELIPAALLPKQEEGEIDQPLIHREIARVQRIVEGESFDIRQRLWSYSERVEAQRQALGQWRQEVLAGEVELDLLAAQAPARWRELRDRLGAEELRQIERRLTLLTIDRCWSDHLAALLRVRDEQHLVSLDGRMPLAEFCRFAAAAYDEMLEEIDDEIVQRFEELPLGEAGVDWEAAGLRGPSATWTYLVRDHVFGENLFLTLAVRPSFFLGAIAVWPLLFGWAIWQRWRGRRAARSAPASE